MSINALDRLDDLAKRNAKGKQVKANSSDYLTISGFRQEHPEVFVNMDLGEWVGKITQSELVHPDRLDGDHDLQ